MFGGSGGGGGVGVGIGFPFGTTQNPPICERTVTFQDGKLAEQNWTGDPGYCALLQARLSAFRDESR